MENLGGVLQIERTRDTGHSRIVMQIESPMLEFPDMVPLTGSLFGPRYRGPKVELAGDVVPPQYN